MVFLVLFQQTQVLVPFIFCKTHRGAHSLQGSSERAVVYRQERSVNLKDADKVVAAQPRNSGNITQVCTPIAL